MELEGRQIPNRLRKQRLSHGYSQIQLANELRMKSTNHISRWEKGVSTPSLRYLLLLCIIYNTTVEELYPEFLNEIKIERSIEEKGYDWNGDQFCD